MSEEVKSASRVVPQVIMLSVAINGCLGFGMLLTVLFCIGNPKDVLSSSTGYPFMEIFYEATNSLPGSLTMCSIVLINYCCSLVGMLAAASRQLWSFSRDKGVPGWRWWSQVSLYLLSKLFHYLTIAVQGFHKPPFAHSFNYSHSPHQCHAGLDQHWFLCCPR